MVNFYMATMAKRHNFKGFSIIWMMSFQIFNTSTNFAMRIKRSISLCNMFSVFLLSLLFTMLSIPRQQSFAILAVVFWVIFLVIGNPFFAVFSSPFRLISLNFLLILDSVFFIVRQLFLSIFLIIFSTPRFSICGVFERSHFQKTSYPYLLIKLLEGLS